MQAFHVTDMTCDACIRALTSAVQEVDPGATLNADLPAKQVRVNSAADRGALAEAMRDAGFTVAAA
jgi:copper chaperone